MKKKTLPVVYALQKTRGANRKRLRQIYQKEAIDRADVEDVLLVLNNLDARGYALNMSKRYYHQALSELDAPGISQPTKAQLESIASFLLDRKY